mgnify:CR=1 FL=1
MLATEWAGQGLQISNGDFIFSKNFEIRPLGQGGLINPIL